VNGTAAPPRKPHWPGTRGPRTVLPKPRMFLPAILTVGRHWFPVIACKGAIVILDIAKTPIEIREGCPLFPSVGNSADGRQGAVFHSYLDAACAIGSRWRGLGMGGREHRAGDQQHCKHAERYFHGRSLQELNLTFSTSSTLDQGSCGPTGAAIGSVL